MVILLIPLSRSLRSGAVTLTISATEDYEQNMHAALSDIATWMASMAKMKKINNVVVYNPMDPIGLTDNDSDKRRILQLWGADQVHPTEAAYQLIAKHLIGFIDTHTARWRRKVQKRLV